MSRGGGGNYNRNFTVYTYERVSMGWWLLQLTIEILANLQLTINNFPLRSPEMFFLNSFFLTTDVYNLSIFTPRD